MSGWNPTDYVREEGSNNPMNNSITGKGLNPSDNVPAPSKYCVN